MHVVTLLPIDETLYGAFSAAAFLVFVAAATLAFGIFVFWLCRVLSLRLRAWRDTRTVMALQEEIAEMGRVPQRTVRFQFAGRECEGVVREVRGRRIRIAFWRGLQESFVWRKTHEVTELAENV
ncbi:MAG: hypothetical protein HYW80_00250 [Parcubacteria group bacterium]|nr:hypothetical protein [Parcubacteria group bacterium]